MRRLTSTHWFRVGLASVSAAGILTALFALAGHSEISVTLQSALAQAAGRRVLVSRAMPWLRRCVEGQPARLGWGLKIAALLPLAVVGTVLACSVITLLGFRPREPFWTCFGHDLSICVLITLTLGISMSLYDAQRRPLDAVTNALSERELEHERARKMALEARLASLEARLQPHFMFNTLNAITALIQDDPDEAERTVERLAALLRFSLDATERGLVPLDHELKIVTDYVEIERTRFGERLAYAIDVHPDAAAGCAVFSSTTSRWRSSAWPACSTPPGAWRSWAAPSTRWMVWPRSPYSRWTCSSWTSTCPGSAAFRSSSASPRGRWSCSRP